MIRYRTFDVRHCTLASIQTFQPNRIRLAVVSGKAVVAHERVQAPLETLGHLHSQLNLHHHWWSSSPSALLCSASVRVSSVRLTSETIVIFRFFTALTPQEVASCGPAGPAAHYVTLGPFSSSRSLLRGLSPNPSRLVSRCRDLNSGFNSLALPNSKVRFGNGVGVEHSKRREIE
jgi:hypothetical protein